MTMLLLKGVARHINDTKGKLYLKFCVRLISSHLKQRTIKQAIHEKAKKQDI